MLDKLKRSRLKMLVVFGIITALLTGFAMFQKMDGPSLTGLAGLAAIVSMYMNGETKRPSK